MRSIKMSALALAFVAVMGMGLAVANPAAAATVDLSSVNNTTSNVRTDTTDQAAAAVDVAVGAVTDSIIDTSATNVVNVASFDADISQVSGDSLLGSLANVSAVDNVTGNLSVGNVGQEALAVSGSGMVDNTNRATAATNGINIGAATVKVVQ